MHTDLHVQWTRSWLAKPEEQSSRRLLLFVVLVDCTYPGCSFRGLIRQGRTLKTDHWTDGCDDDAMA